MTQDKQINISISKIQNWHQKEEISNFELNFYSGQQLIVSTQVKGLAKSKEIILNCNLKIHYPSHQPKIVLHLTQKLGRGGKIILGEITFDLNLLRVHKIIRKQFGKGSKNLHTLVVQLYKSNAKVAKNINSQKNILLNKIKKNDNKDFIRDRVDFLQRYSERSQASSRSSRISQMNLLNKQKNLFKQKNIFSSNNFCTDMTRNHSQTQTLHHRRSQYYENDTRYSNQSIETKNITNRSNALMKYNNGDKKFSSTKSLKSDRSDSKKHYLLVKNLHVLASEEYYAMKSNNNLNHNRKLLQ